MQHRKKSFRRLFGYLAGETIGVRVPQQPACIEEEGADSGWRRMNSMTTKRLMDALKHEENVRGCWRCFRWTKPTALQSR